jgi:hypothetical protein
MKNIKSDWEGTLKSGEIPLIKTVILNDVWNSLRFRVSDELIEFIRTQIEQAELRGYERGKEEERPDKNGPLGWIMTLNNTGQLTVHGGSGLARRICEAFGVKHELNVFLKKGLNYAKKK